MTVWTGTEWPWCCMYVKGKEERNGGLRHRGLGERESKSSHVEKEKSELEERPWSGLKESFLPLPEDVLTPKHTCGDSQGGQVHRSPSWVRACTWKDDATPHPKPDDFPGNGQRSGRTLLTLSTFLEYHSASLKHNLKEDPSKNRFKADLN